MPISFSLGKVANFSVLYLMMFSLASSLTTAKAEAAKTEVTVWCWDPAFNIYAMQEAAKVYEKINPNVKINIVETASADCETKQTVALTSNQTEQLPDIILMQDNSGRKFLSTFPGAYYAMDEKIKYDDFAAYKVKHFTNEGKRYSVPFDNGCAATFVRTDYLEQAGFTLDDMKDITWERFIEIALAVKEKTGNYLLVTQVGFTDFVMMMTQSANTWFFDAEGKPQLNNNPVIRKVVETIVKLRQSGAVKEAVDWTEYIASFNNGSAGGTIQGCWIIGSIVLAEDQAGKWGVTCLPKLDIEGGTHYSSQGGSSWVIPASSKNAEAALDFLQQTYGNSVEFYQTILQKSGAIATWLPAVTGDAYKAPHPFFNNQKVFADLMEYSASIPQVEYGVYNYEARDKLVVAIEEIMQGKNIDDALNEAQEGLLLLMEE